MHCARLNTAYKNTQRGNYRYILSPTIILVNHVSYGVRLQRSTQQCHLDSFVTNASSGPSSMITFGPTGLACSRYGYTDLTADASLIAIITCLTQDLSIFGNQLLSVSAYMSPFMCPKQEIRKMTFGQLYT